MACRGSLICSQTESRWVQLACLIHVHHDWPGGILCPSISPSNAWRSQVIKKQNITFKNELNSSGNTTPLAVWNQLGWLEPLETVWLPFEFTKSFSFSSELEVLLNLEIKFIKGNFLQDNLRIVPAGNFIAIDSLLRICLFILSKSWPWYSQSCISFIKLPYCSINNRKKWATCDCL